MKESLPLSPSSPPLCSPFRAITAKLAESRPEGEGEGGAGGERAPDGNEPPPMSLLSLPEGDPEMKCEDGSMLRRTQAALRSWHALRTGAVLEDDAGGAGGCGDDDDDDSDDDGGGASARGVAGSSKRGESTAGGALDSPPRAGGGEEAPLASTPPLAKRIRT